MDVRVEVTNADIAAARRAWRTASDGNAAPARVELLYGDLRRLVSAQAQQIADDFRAAR